MIYNTSNQARRRKVLESAQTNGIDYLEVRDLELKNTPDEGLRQRQLRVFFLKALPAPAVGQPEVLTRDNFRVDGGQRIQDVTVTEITIENLPGRERKSALVVLDRAGDFSTYTLRMVKDRRSEDPPDGFDQILTRVDFTFKVECPNEFDCEPTEEPVLARAGEPSIDYLVKDYGSFRRLLFDRLSSVLPSWSERSPADVGVALVELMAYVADYQSYYQDAVATEAYLGTARRRVSVRRHARLLDYPMHDGVNARAWICLEVAAGSAADGARFPTGSVLVTEFADDPVVTADALARALTEGAQIFESMHEITLRSARNRLRFWTWGEPQAVLPAGATSAVLLLESSAAALDLRAGDVLIFEEVRDPVSGEAAAADPAHRHVVRLDRDPVSGHDPLFNVDTLEISWHKADALPFPLYPGEVEVAGGALEPISVVYANVVLADHGRTISAEDLIPSEVPESGRYRPHLRLGGVTYSEEYKHEFFRERAARQVTIQDVRQARPLVRLADDDDDWQARPDLLNSDRFATDFVVESEDDGRVTLRFGDNVQGKRPTPGARLRATYRIGSGRPGNVGAYSITQVTEAAPVGITRVFNPLPARGGVEPESIDQVKFYAPRYFQSQERAVTEADYVRIAERHPEVQKAQATLRWTGSWHTVFLSIDRAGGLPVDANFIAELGAFLAPYRLTGHDLSVEPPNFVGLDIQLRVRVRPGYLRSTVKEALLEQFSTGLRADGSRGFFHPDNFTFGQSVYLSNIIALAMATAGVDWVEALRFGRFGQIVSGQVSEEITQGFIALQRLEILRADNDPNAPENGKIDFLMEGGL